MDSRQGLPQKEKEGREEASKRRPGEASAPSFVNIGCYLI